MPAKNFDSEQIQQILKVIGGGMQEQNYFDLPSKEKDGVVQALQSLLEKLEGDDSEEPLMVVQKCADANFAPLPTQYQGVLDKMLAKGSNKKVLGAAQNTFAWDANTKEFVQCIPHSTFRLAQQLDQTDAASTKNIVQRALKTLLGFEKVWKKQTAQLSAITVPTTSADYYIDAKGNVITVNDALEGLPGTLGTIALNKCETATTAEQCEARLDPITKDTGGCLWLPYSSHLEGPASGKGQTEWEKLQTGNPCVDVREIPFPLRPMDKVDEYALAEGKTLAQKGYNPDTKTMAHTMADASTDRKNYTGLPGAKFYGASSTTSENQKQGWTGSGKTAKIGVPTTSALQPQGRQVPYFLGKDGSTSVFSDKGIDKQTKSSTSIARMWRNFKNKSATLPSNVRNEINRMKEQWNAALNSAMVAKTPAEIALEKRWSKDYPDLYEWEVKKLDSDDDFVTFAERTARAVYEFARHNKLDKNDVRAIVRVDLESGKRAIVATADTDKCNKIYEGLGIDRDDTKIKGMTDQDRRKRALLPLTYDADIDGSKDLKGPQGGFLDKEAGLKGKERTIANPGNGVPYMIVQGKNIKDGNIARSNEEYFAAYQPEQLNQDNMFVVLRGGGDPDAYANQLRGGAADERKKKPQYVFHGDTQLTIPTGGKTKNGEYADLENDIGGVGTKTCLFRVGPLVWALLKANFTKYAGWLKEIYAEAAKDNGSIANVEQYRRLVRDMKLRTGRETTNLSGLQQQFLIRALFYPDLDDSDADAYTKIRGALYPVGGGKYYDTKTENLSAIKNSEMAPSLLLRARADVIPWTTELFKDLFGQNTLPTTVEVTKEDGSKENVNLNTIPKNNRGDILLGYMYGKTIKEKDGTYTTERTYYKEIYGGVEALTAEKAKEENAVITDRPIDFSTDRGTLTSTGMGTLTDFTNLLKNPEGSTYIDKTTLGKETLTPAAETFVKMAKAVAYLQRFVPAPTDQFTYPGVGTQWMTRQEIL